MTLRLYYEDSYLREFTATVLEEEKCDEGYIVTLDKSAFYPTSGGQPFDYGTLGGRKILDVYVDKSMEVKHVVDGELLIGSNVKGVIDWKRRFDHMQQHAGEHMIAGAVWQKLKGTTIGLHLGKEFSTIDVDMPDGSMRVSQEAIDDIEYTVNEWIQRDLPIKCYFPTPEELAAEHLRKPPTVSEHIRLVKIGDVECVACGGTHPSTTGQVSLVKIIDVRPSKGKMRISFVCGMRAFSDYRERYNASTRAARLLSANLGDLPDAVEKALTRINDLEREIKAEKDAIAASKLEGLIEKSIDGPGGIRIVAGVLDNVDQGALCDSAKKIVKDMGLFAILANGEGEGANLIFAGPEKCGIDMGKVISSAVVSLGGKGGGRGEFARGAGPGAKCVEAGVKILRSMRCE